MTHQPHTLSCRRHVATDRILRAPPRGIAAHLRALSSIGALLLISACSVIVVPTFDPVVVVDQHGDSRATATMIVPQSRTEGHLARGDIDYFRIKVTRSGSLTVYTKGSTDTFGVLQDSSGRTIVGDNDSGGGRNFLIEHRLDLGVYYISVEGANSDAIGDYTLVVEQSADVHGDSPATATTVTAPSTTEGDLARGDIDYFRIKLKDFSYLVVRTSGDTDTLGVLQDASGRPVAKDDDSGRGLNFAIGHRLSAGVYYVRVSGDGAEGAYALTVERTGIDEHGSSRSTATYVPPDSDIYGFLQVRDVDYFKTVVDEDVVLRVFSTGTTDTAARLEDAAGRKLIADNDDGSGLNFSFSARLGPGTYYIRVKGYLVSTAGKYRLWVMSKRVE